MLKFQKARKNHKCDLCGKKIPKGDKYWRRHEEDKIQHTISVHKEHTNCEIYKGEFEAE